MSVFITLIVKVEFSVQTLDKKDIAAQWACPGVKDTLSVR